MSKKKDTIRYDASDVVEQDELLSFPGDLQGLLHDVNHQTEANEGKADNAVPEAQSAVPVNSQDPKQSEHVQNGQQGGKAGSHEDKAKETAASESSIPSEESKLPEKANTKKTAKQSSSSSTQENDGDLWNMFTAMCEEDKKVQKKMGRGNLGTSSTVRVEKDILEALRLCPVEGHSITTMVNSIVRVFFQTYRDRFKEYQMRVTNPLLR